MSCCINAAAVDTAKYEKLGEILQAIF
jgi:hypothetical protein